MCEFMSLTIFPHTLQGLAMIFDDRVSSGLQVSKVGEIEHTLAHLVLDAGMIPIATRNPSVLNA